MSEVLKESERDLIELIKNTESVNSRSIILQLYIQEAGPLSNEAGNIIKDLLKA